MTVTPIAKYRDWRPVTEFFTKKSTNIARTPFFWGGGGGGSHSASERDAADS